MPAVAAVAAIGALGYGIYSSQEAMAQSREQFNEAQKQAQANQQAQEQMVQQQQQQAQQLQQQQQAEQQANIQAQQTAQQTALANAQAAIPGIQQQLGQSINQQNQLALQQQEPVIEGRLNQLGLLNSGALPEAQAKYQAALGSQLQGTLANYGTQANQAIQNQALNYTGTDSAALQQNLMQTLQNQQSAQNQLFQNQGQAYVNNVAQQQYLANLQAAQNAQQQAFSNQMINFGGQIGGGMLNYASRNPNSFSLFGGVSSSMAPAMGSPAQMNLINSDWSGYSPYNFSGPSTSDMSNVLQSYSQMSPNQFALQQSTGPMNYNPYPSSPIQF